MSVRRHGAWVEGTDVLLTVSEVAVAFAGFASIVVVFQHRDPAQWSPAIVVRIRTMIEASLSTLFSALLPFVLHHLGLAGSELWAVSSLLLAVAHVTFGVRVARLSAGLISRRQLSRRFSGAVLGVAILIVVVLLLNGTGLGFGPSFGPYLVAVTWALGFSSLMFLRVVVLPVSEWAAT
jgi:hypothetical protein